MTDHLTPDLDNPILGLLVAALLAWAAVGVMWLHDHRAAVARLRRIVLARLGFKTARAEAHDAAWVGRSVHRHHRRDQRRRARRQLHGARSSLELTSDEVVALARYLGLGWRVEWSVEQVTALNSAHAKIGERADLIILAERAGRR